MQQCCGLLVKRRAYGFVGVSCDLLKVAFCSSVQSSACIKHDATAYIWAVIYWCVLIRNHDLVQSCDNSSKLCKLVHKFELIFLVHTAHIMSFEADCQATVSAQVLSLMRCSHAVYVRVHICCPQTYTL